MCKKTSFIHELGTLVNNGNTNQVRNKKKLLGKLYTRKLGKLLQF